jgi:hypothetical protein
MTVVRTNTSNLGMADYATCSRATIREVNDKKKLMQEIKYADVYHSETPSDFERPRICAPVPDGVFDLGALAARGVTASPLPVAVVCLGARRQLPH